MLVYGSPRLFNSPNFTRIQNHKRFNSKKLYRTNVQPSSRSRQWLSISRYSMFFPGNWQYILFQCPKSFKYTVYAYTHTYYFLITIPQQSSTVSLDMWTRSVSVHTFFTSNSLNLYWHWVNDIFKSFNKPFFIKIKFKGKGYYIYKNKRQTITPQFGYSHRLYLYAYYATVIFQSKTHIFIFGLIHSDLVRTAVGVKLMRPINIFTGRGVRFSRQIIYKKVGKVSSYR